MSDSPDSAPPRAIATLNEGPLHAALKAWALRPGDRVEVPVDGRQIDIVRNELLVEIQTSSLSSLRAKLQQLLERHAVLLVHPVPLVRWIVRVEADGSTVLSRRRSPRRGRIEDAFAELASLGPLLSHPGLVVELLLTHEEEVRRHAPGRAWRRRGWVVVERRLVEVVSRHLIRGAADLEALLPPHLPPTFTTADLAAALEVPRALAQKMAYCLRQAGAVEEVGREGNARRYRAAGRAHRREATPRG